MAYRRKAKQEHAAPSAWAHLTAAQSELMDATVLDVLTRREGQRTEVALHTGQVLQVYNIHFGYDLGATFAYVHTNDNPHREGMDPSALFFTDQVVSIIDPESGELLFEAKTPYVK